MDSLKKVSKKTWIIIAAVIIVLGGIWYFVSHKKVSVLNKEDIHVTFSGYDSRGTYDIEGGDKVEKKIVQTLIDKTKLSDYWKSKVKNNVEDLDDLEDFKDPEGLDGMEAVFGQKLKPSERKNLLRMGQWATEIDDEVDDNSKTSGLSNGDKVTLAVTVEPNGDKDSSDSAEDHELKSNPIKPQKLTFTVKGLKKIKTASTQTVLKGLKVSFAGFNGKGQAVLTSKGKLLDDQPFTVKKNGQLSNGDQVKIKAPARLFRDDALNYKGAKSLTVKVHGLKDVKKISNLDEVTKVTDALINDRNDSNDIVKYDNNFVSMYAIPRLANAADEEDNDYDEDVDNEVRVNEFHGTLKNNLRIIVLYKTIADYEDGAQDTDYYRVTLTGLHYSDDDQVDIDKLNTEDNSEIESVSGSLTTEEHNLAADGVKIK